MAATTTGLDIGCNRRDETFQSAARSVSSRIIRTCSANRCGQEMIRHIRCGNSLANTFGAYRERKKLPRRGGARGDGKDRILLTVGADPRHERKRKT